MGNMGLHLSQGCPPLFLFSLREPLLCEIPFFPLLSVAFGACRGRAEVWHAGYMMGLFPQADAALCSGHSLGSEPFHPLSRCSLWDRAWTTVPCLCSGSVHQRPACPIKTVSLTPCLGQAPPITALCQKGRGRLSGSKAVLGKGAVCR